MGGEMATRLDQIKDEDLAEAATREHAALPVKAQHLVLLLVAGGKSFDEAAQEAGYAQHGSTLSRLRQRVEPALSLMREQGRRKSFFTLEAAVRKFLELYEEARELKDISAARACLREASLLCAHYPELRMKLAVEHQVDLRAVTDDELEQLAQLRHGVRPQLAAANVIDAVALEVAPTVDSLGEDLSDVLR